MKMHKIVYGWLKLTKASIDVVAIVSYRALRVVCVLGDHLNLIYLKIVVK